jgi:hypothetical protein
MKKTTNRTKKSAKKKPAKKKSAKKSAKKPAKKKSAKKSAKGSKTDSFRDAKAKFYAELAKQPNVTFLTRAESDAIIANSEFNGCIARPKSQDSN